jgi:hypothetical protein
LLLIPCILAAPTTVRGDTIRITSGALSPTSFDLAVVDIALASADHGFSLSARGVAFDGLYQLYEECFQGPLCVPGQIVGLDAGWSGSDLPGTATADGLTFEVGSATAVIGSVDAEFSGTWTPPPFTGVTTTSVTAPFTFTGVVDYPGPPLDDLPNPFPRRRDMLVGSGIATIKLVWEPGNAQFGAWTYAGSRYEFTTPEPATLLLVGPCAFALARWRRITRVERS